MRLGEVTHGCPTSLRSPEAAPRSPQTSHKDPSGTAQSIRRGLRPLPTTRTTSRVPRLRRGGTRLRQTWVGTSRDRETGQGACTPKGRAGRETRRTGEDVRTQVCEGTVGSNWGLGRKEDGRRRRVHFRRREGSLDRKLLSLDHYDFREERPESDGSSLLSWLAPDLLLPLPLTPTVPDDLRRRLVRMSRTKRVACRSGPGRLRRATPDTLGPWNDRPGTGWSSPAS